MANPWSWTVTVVSTPGLPPPGPATPGPPWGLREDGDNNAGWGTVGRVPVSHSHRVARCRALVPG